MLHCIETERLRLRQWKDSDRRPFHQLNNDSEVMRYFPDVLSKSQSDAVISRLSDLIDQKGWGFWAVELKDSGEFIGFVGLLAQGESVIPNTPFIEIGWRLDAAFWGKGYATEAARASLEFAFTNLNVAEVYSFTVLDNLPSRQVMSRIGMADTGQNFNHPKIAAGHSLERHCLYKITYQRWCEQVKRVTDDSS